MGLPGTSCRRRGDVRNSCRADTVTGFLTYTQTHMNTYSYSYKRICKDMDKKHGGMNSVRLDCVCAYVITEGTRIYLHAWMTLSFTSLLVYYLYLLGIRFVME